MTTMALPLTDEMYEWDPAEDEQHLLLRLAVKCLPERDSEILHRRYWGDQTYAEVGRAVGVSKQSVRALESQAVSRLRRMIAWRDRAFTRGRIRQRKRLHAAEDARRRVLAKKRAAQDAVAVLVHSQGSQAGWLLCRASAADLPSDRRRWASAPGDVTCGECSRLVNAGAPFKKRTARKGNVWPPLPSVPTPWPVALVLPAVDLPWWLSVGDFVQGRVPGGWASLGHVVAMRPGGTVSIDIGGCNVAYPLDLVRRPKQGPRLPGIGGHDE